MGTPILDNLITRGIVRVTEHGELVGTASDGVEVLIGQDLDREGAERYLTDFPTPDKW